MSRKINPDTSEQNYNMPKGLRESFGSTYRNCRTRNTKG